MRDDLTLLQIMDANIRDAIVAIEIKEARRTAGLVTEYTTTKYRKVKLLTLKHVNLNVNRPFTSDEKKAIITGLDPKNDPYDDPRYEAKEYETARSHLTKMAPDDLSDDDDQYSEYDERRNPDECEDDPRHMPEYPGWPCTSNYPGWPCTPPSYKRGRDG
jgi:hypothetical protein